MVSIVRSLLKGEALRFSADFTLPLSCGRSFEFSRHIVGSLGINSIIAMSDMNTHSTVFNTNTDKDTYKDTDKHREKDKERTWTRTQT